MKLEFFGVTILGSSLMRLGTVLMRWRYLYPGSIASNLMCVLEIEITVAKKEIANTGLFIQHRGRWP